jgi:oligopeptide transport system substrate-binding protein
MLTKWLSLFLIPVCLLALIGCRKHEPLANTSSTLRISSEGDPQTLDPRRVRDLPTVTVIHMLYEGLTRNQKDGQPAPALAETVTISPDQKTYIFKLRKSEWSDGRPVTAQDFEQTWKSLLDPQFPSPNAYQLYAIQGAQDAKEGRTSTEQIGIYAKDDSTLVVQLDQPTPHFLHLTATHFYYPVHPSLRQPSSNSSNSNESQVVTNGPFKLENWSRHNELSVIQNPYYWDKKNVHLNRITLIVVDNPIALQLFQRGEIDWTGSPLSTLSTDALASLKHEKQLEMMPAAGVYLFRINTERPPFTHSKMRQAFAMALNRKDLVEHVLQGNQLVALGIIPPSFINGHPFFEDHDVSRARELFQEALKEQGLGLENFPRISIHYASGERAHKIAQVAQQQWKENLGIDVDLQSGEAKSYYDRLKTHDYQLGIGSWFADFRDPISFLEIFRLKENGTNNTQWENQDYITFLDQSTKATERAEREQLLKSAEKVLMQDMPIVPLFYSSYNYVKNPSLQGIYFSELGYLDFKNAYWESKQNH